MGEVLEMSHCRDKDRRQWNGVDFLCIFTKVMLKTISKCQIAHIVIRLIVEKSMAEILLEKQPNYAVNVCDCLGLLVKLVRIQHSSLE